MPLYDCLLLAKTKVKKEALIDLTIRLGSRVFQRNGVITEIKSFGTINLAYGIKKLDGRHYQGQLMQLTMMVPPSFPKELHFLNKEDQLLRWLIVKHRGIKYGLDANNEEDALNELKLFKTSSLSRKDDDDDDDYDDDGDV